MANKNTKSKRKVTGYKVSTGVNVDSHKLRADAGKKPYLNGGRPARQPYKPAPVTPSEPKE